MTVFRQKWVIEALDHWEEVSMSSEKGDEGATELSLVAGCIFIGSVRFAGAGSHEYNVGAT
jgi:hypothetical protein